LEASEEVAREHSLDKPDGPAAGILAIPNPRGKALQAELPPESSCSEVLVLRVSFQAKPICGVLFEEFRGRKRHRY
jgi:hypothetical protein